MALGLDDATGLVWSGTLDDATLAERMGGNPILAAGVRRVLDAAYALALTLVRRHHAAVSALAAEILVDGVLDGAQAAAILAKHHPVKPECRA